MLIVFKKILDNRAWVYVIGIIAFVIAHLYCGYGADQTSNNEPVNEFSWIQFWPPDIVPHPHFPDPNSPDPERIARYEIDLAVINQLKELLSEHPFEERYEILRCLICYLRGDLDD
jgi:hypothetical protein